MFGAYWIISKVPSTVAVVLLLVFHLPKVFKRLAVEVVELFCFVSVLRQFLMSFVWTIDSLDFGVEIDFNECHRTVIHILWI